MPSRTSPKTEDMFSKMKNAQSLDDLLLFASVARHGTLTAAAEASGSSPATLSRKMKTLEDRMGRRLFLHGAKGYALTADGRALFERAASVEAAADQIADWQAGSAGRTRVRISAGPWTMHYLTAHLPRIWGPGANWVPELMQSSASLDLARREIDIGIRNRRPTQPWLAGRKTATRDFAVYGASADVTGYVVTSEASGPAPSQNWLRARSETQLVTTANDPLHLLPLARAGIGRVVLPCFIGDHETGVMRLSDPIRELQIEEWLVCHREARFDPPIRAALDALAAFLRESPGLVAQDP